MTLDDSGTTSALTPSTPSTLSTRTSAGVYAAEIDCANLAAGEHLIADVFTKTLTGGTSTKIESQTVSWHALAKKIIIDPIAADIEFKLVVTQIGGSGRTFPWKVLKA